MKIDYKILVVDDKPKDLEIKLNNIDVIARENFFIPRIDFAIQQIFKQPPLMGIFDRDIKKNDMALKIFNEYDLILMDLHIATKKEDSAKTGEVLIKKLRDSGICTEIVFYSNAMEEYRKQDDKKKLELDNITYADKSELVLKVERIIKRKVVQALNISELRGYLMDSTSEFDFACKEVSLHYFNKLSPDDQKDIIKSIEKYIHDQYLNTQSKFKKINDIYKDVDFSTKKKIEGSLSDGKNLVDKLKKALDQIESVMVTKCKFRIMAEIVRKNKIDLAYEISMFDGKEYNDIYDDALVKKRNIFGHSKLIYGKKCGNKIVSIKAVQEEKCECKEDDFSDCIHEKIFTHGECLMLRKDIYNYYSVFNKLLDSISNKG